MVLSKNSLHASLCHLNLGMFIQQLAPLITGEQSQDYQGITMFLHPAEVFGRIAVLSQVPFDKH
jgi:hypothetical protein